MSKTDIGVISWEKQPPGFESYLQRAKSEVEKLKGQGVELVLLPGNTGGEENITAEDWFSIHGEIAKDFNVFLVPGPIKNPAGKMVSVIFDYSGNEIGIQAEIGSKKKGDINIFPTELGNLALSLGKDVYTPEYGRVLAGMGGDIVLAPLVDREKLGGWRWELSGLWREVQRNQFWGVEAGCKSRPGAVFAPCEATKDRTGILKKGWGSIRASLEEKKREEARQIFPVGSQLSSPTVENFLEKLSGGGQ